MGTKGYRNIAKSGVKAATAKREQAVAKQRTRRKPRDRKPPRKTTAEIETVNGQATAEPGDERQDEPRED